MGPHLTTDGEGTEVDVQDVSIGVFVVELTDENVVGEKYPLEVIVIVTVGLGKKEVRIIDVVSVTE